MDNSNDIIIGRARVIAVEEVSVSPAQQPVVISRLKIEAAGVTPGFSTIEGIMSIPKQLPFGKSFNLTLCSTDELVDKNERLFKEGEDG